MNLCGVFITVNETQIMNNKISNYLNERLLGSDPLLNTGDKNIRLSEILSDFIVYQNDSDKNSVIDVVISESDEGVNGVCDKRKHNWDYIKGKIHCDQCGHPLHVADER